MSEMTLTEFLLARIAEDEWDARNATPGRWHADEDYSTITAAPFKSAREAYDRADPDADCWVVPESMDSSVGAHNLCHIARHDPARVLAECEAKRRIVEFVKPDPTMPVDSGRYVAAGVLALLALPYADHPDYREEWKP